MGTPEEHDLPDQPWQTVRSKESGAVEPAGQLHNVGVELFYMLHKLGFTDALGFLEHLCDVVPLLLSHIVGNFGEKVEHHAVIK